MLIPKTIWISRNHVTEYVIRYRRVNEYKDDYRRRKCHHKYDECIYATTWLIPCFVTVIIDLFVVSEGSGPNVKQLCDSSAHTEQPYDCYYEQFMRTKPMKNSGHRIEGVYYSEVPEFTRERERERDFL